MVWGLGVWGLGVCSIGCSCASKALKMGQVHLKDTQTGKPGARILSFSASPIGALIVRHLSNSTVGLGFKVSGFGVRGVAWGLCFGDLGNLGFIASAQRLQNPLIKEYTL